MNLADGRFWKWVFPLKIFSESYALLLKCQKYYLYTLHKILAYFIDWTNNWIMSDDHMENFTRSFEHINLVKEI